MKLYEISEKYLSFLNLCESGKTPPDAVADTLSAIEDEFDQKADNLACMIKNLKSEANAIKIEVAVLEKRKIQKEKTIDNLRNYLISQMKIIQKEKFETARNKVQIRRNPESVQVAPDFVKWAEESGNKKFLKFKPPEPDKTAIKEALKNGVIFSFAELIQTERIDIK